MAYLGKIVKEFLPTEENSRNSEGAFIDMPDGRIAFVYTRYRRGRAQDGDSADLAISYSYDNGESFSEPEVILTPEDCDAMNIMSVSLIKRLDGSIGLFYLKKAKGLQCHLFMRITRDFKSFSEEYRCINEEGYHVVNNDRVRRLSDGRLIFPAGYVSTESKPPEADHNNGAKGFCWPPSTARFYISEDDGINFKTVAETEMPHKVLCRECDEYGDKALQEPGVIELDDGSIYAWYRTGALRQYESFSYDKGMSWSVPEPSRFTSPPSPLSAMKMSDGRILVGYNPAPVYFGRSTFSPSGDTWTGGRTPYVIELADGNMNRLTKPRIIEDDLDRGFCYCAMFETDDAVLLAYCAGGGSDFEHSCLMRTRIRRILKSEL
jgi:hypothetical protein